MTQVYHTNLTHIGATLTSSSHLLCCNNLVAEIPFSASKIGMEFIPSAGFPFMVAVCIKKSNSYQAAGWKWQLKVILSNNQLINNNWLLFWTVCSNFTFYLSFTFVSELFCWTSHKYWRKILLKELGRKKFRSMISEQVPCPCNWLRCEVNSVWMSH